MNRADSPRSPRGDSIARSESQGVQEAILAGYRDLAAGCVFASSGDFKTDMAELDGKQREHDAPRAKIAAGRASGPAKSADAVFDRLEAKYAAPADR